ncbi:MAG: nickel-dependent hydrogenase large subunit [Desulfobacterales bacterium]
MKTVKIMDPVTRIEGHLKVEVTIDSINGVQQVVDAHCTGTLFRGFETLLKGRKPIDATVITQRICGVCPISHGQTSVLALESVSEWKAPAGARLLRNLTLGANFLQSHILHFYLLAALDYAEGPAASPWAPAWNVDMRPGAGSAMEHLANAIEARRRAHDLGAALGGRMPTSHAFVPGGFSQMPSDDQIRTAKAHLEWLLGFIRNTYIPDVETVAHIYTDYGSVGRGCGNLFAFGVFEMDDDYATRLFEPGYVQNGGSVVRSSIQTRSITEAVKHSWYQDETGGLTPDWGETRPLYPKPGAYSWLKAPRLFDQPFEAGPLARMRVNGDYTGGISVMDRHLARAYETLKIAEAMSAWFFELGGSAYDTAYEQYAGVGVGLSEAPRGALGHWVEIREKEIANYQIITPTCWNASPRDDKDVPGPMEQALIGTPIEDRDQPLEVLRVIHSFDPCLSCAVHMIRPDRKPVVVHGGAGRCTP